MDEATLKERLRQYGSKIRCFCPGKNGDRPHFVRKRTFSTCGHNSRKRGLSPMAFSVDL